MSGEETPKKRHRGQGRLFRRKASPFWYCSYCVGGKVRKESTKTTGILEADAFLDMRLEFVNKDKRNRTRSGTVNEILEFYVADCVKAEKSWALAGQLQHVAEVIGDIIGWMKLAHVDLASIKTLRNRLEEGGRSLPTVNRYLAVLHRAFTFARYNGLVETMPVFPPRYPESKPREGVMTYAKYVAIRNELPPWAQDIFEFTYYTGWRRGEVLNLTWANLDFEAGVVRLRSTETKSKRPRQRPIGPDIEPVIQRRLAQRVLTVQNVFHKAGRRVECHKWYSAWDPARKRAGFPGALLHDCRRAAYKNLLRAGALPKVAAEMVGWTSDTMPRRYFIVDEADQQEAVQLLHAYHMRIAEASARGEVVKFEKK